MKRLLALTAAVLMITLALVLPVSAAEASGETVDPVSSKEYNTISLNGQLYAILPFVDGDHSGQYDSEEFSTHHYPKSDFDDTLDLLVAEYLSSGEGYEDILNAVYYQYVCDSTLLYSSYSMLEYYHNDGIADFPEYMLREVTEDGGWGNEYYVAKYGDMTTFDEYENYLKQRFDSEIIFEVINDSCPNVINVDGYIFARDCGIGKSGQERDPKYSLTIEKDMIVLREKRTVYDWDPNAEDAVPTDKFVYNDYILQRVKYGGEYVWQWKNINYCYPVEDEYPDSAPQTGFATAICAAVAIVSAATVVAVGKKRR